MKQLATAILIPSLLGGTPTAAAIDFELGAYVQLPLERGESAFGLSAKPIVRGAREQDLSPIDEEKEIGLHLRYGSETSPVVMLNGVSLARPKVLNQDAEPETSDDQSFDWYAVVGIALSVGLIAAVASSDNTSISGCSGQNCPPPKPEPPEPEE